MGRGQAKSTYRAKKRKFSSNQHTKRTDETESSPTTSASLPSLPSRPRPHFSEEEEDGNAISCTSAKKLRLSIENQEREKDDYYILMSFSMLKRVVDSISNCKACSEPLELTDDECRFGLCHQLSFQCKHCGWSEKFYSSPTSNKTNPESPARRHMFDVNIRSVVAFREIGKGHTALSTFSGLMNLSKPLAKTQYNKVNEKLLTAYQATALQSCSKAADETRAQIDVMTLE